ncbi:MAG: MerR family transcriptional regulator [Gemmatimonadetes bacterium]|nr:MerR family transcriptional regulator [Gemmatimonadota bacterium]
MSAKPEPVREFYSIGDVCEMLELKPHVLRYWESQFKVLSPNKNRSGNRVYTRRELEFVQLVKHLLYTEKYTVEGARQQLESRRRDGGLRATARQALDLQSILQLEKDLKDILITLQPPARRSP